MDAPDTRYTRSGDVHLAYQVFGDGGLDLVFLAEFWNSIEAMWEQPDYRRFLERLGSFARVICIDQRGTGSSDPVSLSDMPTLEVWSDDVITTMEAAGSTKASVVGVGGGGGVGMLFAATAPERVNALVPLNATARYTRAPDYPWGTSPEFEARIEKELAFGWGRGVLLETVGPNVAGDPAFRGWWARYQRLGSSPGTVLAMRHMLQQLDVRDVLPSIRVPTLVISRRDNRLVEAVHGRYLGEHIPGARYVEVEGDDSFPFIGNADVILDEIEEFLTGSRPSTGRDRMLATILVTDIVDSTARASELGDLAWRDVVGRHHALVRREVERHRGHEVDTAGDGFLATFDGPARAIRCACAVRDGVRSLGLEIRSGPAHGRGRARGRWDPRHRRAYERARGRRGLARRDPGLEHGPGPGRRVGHRLRRPGPAHAQRRARAMAPVHGGGRVKVIALAGGIGAGKFLRGLVRAVPPEDVTVVVNTGDDITMHGLHVSPDLDSVTYWLGGVFDHERGWGRRDETFRATEELRSFDPQQAWFNLGDLDLATHLFRTNLLAAGKTLSEATAAIAARFAIGPALVPMSDDPVATRIVIVSDGAEIDLHFQEYWVRRGGRDEVKAIRYEGADRARPAPGVLEAVSEADAIVLCPSNPVASIGPILAVPGIRDALSARRSDVVGVSGIVAGAPLAGMADRLMPAAGAEVSAAGAAAWYEGLLAAWVVDDADRSLIPRIEATGVRAGATDSIMTDDAKAEALARFALGMLA